MPVGSGTSTGGSQISLREYKDLVRGYLRDWDYEDAVQATISDSATAVTVRDGAKFAADDIIQIEAESVLVTLVATNTLTIVRGWRGTAITTHVAGAQILKGINWTDAQLADWINESFGIIYPDMYVRDTTTLTGSSTTYDYVLPAAITESNQIESIEAQYGADLSRLKVWSGGVTIRGEPPELYLPAGLSGYTLTVTYTKPFDTLAGDNDRTTLPTRAKLLPVYYTAARALEQREALRCRYDAYAVVQDERVVTAGQQIVTGKYYYQLFNNLLSRVKMSQRGKA